MTTSTEPETIEGQTAKAVDPATPCSTFTVSPDDAAKIRAFQDEVEKKRGSSYAGASGGATTYAFTPTSLGVIFTVEHFKETLDLTDYASW